MTDEDKKKVVDMRGKESEIKRLLPETMVVLSKHNSHRCSRSFPTRKIDDCSGVGVDQCYGIQPMTLLLWFCDQDGTETYCDGYVERQVDYCPFCGTHTSGVEFRWTE